MYVCLASIAIEEVTDNPKTTNDDILQTVYQIILCKAVTSSYLQQNLYIFVTYMHFWQLKKFMLASTYHESFGVRGMPFAIHVNST